MRTALRRSIGQIGSWHLAALLGLGISACSAPNGGAAGKAEVDDGSIRGQLVESIARFDDGHAEISYQLHVNGSETNVRQLTFEVAPDLMPYSEIKVWGVPEDGKIHVTDWRRVDDSESIGAIGQPLVGTPPLAPLKLAMAIVDIGAGNLNAAITPAELQKRIFDNPDSTRAYYLESSYQMQPMTGKVVGNVLSYPMTTCDTSGMASTLKAMVDGDVGQASDVYLWYFQGKSAACSWSGLSSGNNTFYNASAGCVVLAQEPGHSLGLAHSSAMTCTGAPFLDDPNMGCTHNEYGNPYDVMGSGCHQFASYQKTYRTYQQHCNVVKVRQSGTFNLFPTEAPCDAIQSLWVPMPHVRPFTNSGGGGSGARDTQLAYYIIEYRVPMGFDTGLKPSVFVMASPAWTTNSAASRGNSRGEHTWILSLGSGTSRDGTAHALAPGSSFTDPSGTVVITTMAQSNDYASIKIDITGASTVDGGTGDNVCVDGTPIAAPGLASCGADGGVIPPPPPPVDASSPPPPRDAGRDAPVVGTGGAAGGTTGTTTTGTTTTGTAGAGGSGPGTTGTTAGTTTGGGATGSAGSGTTSGSTTGSTTGATTGTSGAGGSKSSTGDSVGGCACRVATPDGRSGGGRGLAMLGFAIAAVLRRRPRRSIVR
jgi:hypothetical protein